MPFAETEVQHDYCMVIKVKFKDVDLILTSDIGLPVENKLVKSYGSFLKSDILKVAHHGSKNSSSAEFISYVNPTFSIISCGFENRFNHPSPVTLVKLFKTGSIVSRTDLDGAVVIESNGKYIHKINW